MIEWIKGLYKKYRKQFWFLVSGGTNTLLDYGIYIVLLSTTDLPVMLCHAVGYTAGIICSFLMNKNLTFSNKDKNNVGQMARFVGVNLFTLALSTLLIGLLEQYTSIHKFLIKLPVAALMAVISYLGYNVLVFNKKDEHGGAENDG